MKRESIAIGYLRDWKNTQSIQYKYGTRNSRLQFSDTIVYFLKENIPNIVFYPRLIFLNIFYSTFLCFLTQIVLYEIKKEHTTVTPFMKTWFPRFSIELIPCGTHISTVSGIKKKSKSVH